MSPLKILLITHEVSRTGAPRVALMAAKALQVQGHSVHVISRFPGPLLPEFMSVVPVSVEFLHRFRRRLRSIPGLGALAWVLDSLVVIMILIRHRPDLVYVNSSAAAIYLRPAHWLRRKVILHVHESKDVVTSFLLKARARKSLAQVTAVACSPSVRKDLAALTRRRADDVPMVLSVPDDALVLKLAGDIPDLVYPDDELVVGCCGAVEYRKGADIWVEIARQVKASACDLPVRFVWVGQDDPSERPIDIPKSVNFIGSRANPYSHMRRFDVFTLPSRDDPFPLVVIEAMLLGRPIVAFDIGGVPQQIGQAGVIVGAGDAMGFAEQVVRLLSDAAHRARLGSAARTRAAADFSTVSFGAALSEVVTAAV